MSVMEKLDATYEAAAAGDFESYPCPPGHVESQADIEIMLNWDGELLSARCVAQELTLIPATEESAGRTSGGAPHPLCDKIQYVAGDYRNYVKGGKSYFDDFESGGETQQGYFSLLSEWEAFAKHPMLTAVKRYVAKRSVLYDLIEAGIFHLDADGGLSEEWEAKKEPRNAFVRWRVQRQDVKQDKVWNNRELIDSWIKFLLSRMDGLGLCYVTGKVAPCAANHPARLRYAGDKAKLISSNDGSGYTFRGHFLTPDEACTVSYEATQKAHSALRWLIGRQSFKNDTQIIVAWAVNNAPIPNINVSTNGIGMADDVDDFGDEAPGCASDIGEEYALKLVKKLRGYKKELKDRDDVVVMALDSATTGRMAITYYREIKGSDFLARVEDYHKRYAWRQNFGKERRFIGAPALRDIAKMACPGESNVKLMKATISRLIPVIVDGVPMPKDIVTAICRKAANPAAKEPWEREALLGAACGLYAGSHIERGYKMSLDESKCTRDYLYGRLLAVADKIEGHALGISSDGKNRDTSAIKLMQRFAAKPCETWMRIEQNLIPYISRLQARAPKSLTFYNSTLDGIYNLFKDEDFNDNSPLSPEFLLGYHCQRSELWKKTKDAAGASEPQAEDKTQG